MPRVEEIDANAATYQEQAFKVLDRDPRDSRCAATASGSRCEARSCLALRRTTTVGPVAGARRLRTSAGRAEQPVSVLELLYPLLQGYDSVAVQRRRRARRHRPDLQPAARPRHPARLRAARAGRPDDAAAGRDRRAWRRCRKSLGNQIGVTDPPGEMYGSRCAIPDEAMAEWYRLLLGASLPAGADPQSGQARAGASGSRAAFTIAQAARRGRGAIGPPRAARGRPSEIEEVELAPYIGRRARPRPPAGADRRRVRRFSSARPAV